MLSIKQKDRAIMIGSRFVFVLLSLLGFHITEAGIEVQAVWLKK
jgi:hypothetical protein